MNRKARAFAAAAACVLILTASAFAQQPVVPATTTVTTTTIDVGSIFGAWKPYIVEILSIAVMAVGGWLAELARRKFNLSIEASHRDALQTALTNGAGLVLNKLGNNLQGKTIDVHSALLATAIEYVTKAAPNALAQFDLGPKEIAERIVAKLPQVANTTTSTPSPAA